MSESQVQQLIKGAIKAAQSGDKALARKAFIQALKLDPRNETALVGLVTVTTDATERITILRQTLKLFPQSEKALEAVRRLGLTVEQVMSAPTAPLPTPPSTAELTAPPQPAKTNPLNPQDIPTERSVSKPLKSLRATSELKTGALTPPPSNQPPSPFSEEIPTTSEPLKFSVPEPVPPPTEAPRPTLEQAFARYNQLPSGDSGIPVPAPNVLHNASQQADGIVQAVMMARNTVPNDTPQWVKKDKNRAGEGDIVRLRLQVAGATFAFLLVATVIGFFVALSNEDVKKIVFAPTFTLSPTPTVTPTNTPGVTPTPSVTPEVTLTPSPTLPGNIARKNPLYQVPYTPVFAPQGVIIEQGVEDAVTYSNNQRYDDAIVALRKEQEATSLTGNFVPYYFLIDAYLRQNDLENANKSLTDGTTAWTERGSSENYLPLVEVARSKVALADIQARRLVGETIPPQEFEQTTDAILTDLDDAIARTKGFGEAYITKADYYLLLNQTEDALATLDEGILRDLVTDATLRTKKAQILFTQGDFDRALQELYDALLIEPFAEEALYLQVLCALGKGQPGQAVIFAEQYMARYPGSVLAVKLRGDAWLAEGKTDLALQEYNRALGGDETDADYVETLISRANLYLRTAQYDLAQDDFATALKLSQNDPRIRFARANAAFLAQNYTVALNDTQILVERSEVPLADVQVLQAQIFIVQDENLDEAVTLLQTALASNTLNSDKLATAQTYLAQAELTRGNFDVALTAINEALNMGDGLERRFLRGQILEGKSVAETQQSRRVELIRQALVDYQFVLTWSNYYSFGAVDDVQSRYEALSRSVALSS